MMMAEQCCGVTAFGVTEIGFRETRPNAQYRTPNEGGYFMIPGMGGMDPKQMQKMMKQMGINTTEIDAKRVVIETDSENIVITEPSITQIEMQGQKSYQISGKVSTEQAIKEDDVKMIMEQAGVPRSEALAALKEANGDIAEAIMRLKG